MLSNITVYASVLNNEEGRAFQVFQQGYNIGIDKEPTYTVSFAVNEVGNVTYYEGIMPENIPRVSRVEDIVVGAFNFYNMGYDSSKDSQFYEVELIATCEVKATITIADGTKYNVSTTLAKPY